MNDATHRFRRDSDSERWAWAYANGTCEPPLNTAVASRQEWIDAARALTKDGEPYWFERLCERLHVWDDYCEAPDDGRSFDEWMEGFRP